MNIKIVLPAYNEEESLPPLLARIDKANLLFGWNAKVVVVNDGSKDKTLEIAQNYRGSVEVIPLDLQPNRGLAGAMRAGLTFASENAADDDIIICLDADDSQNPYLINRMLNQIHEGSDLVIASRYQHGARVVGLSKSRELFSIGAGMLFRIMVGFRGVKDYTCGFRAYKASLLKKTIANYGDDFITQKGFGCMVEILIKCGLSGAIMHEVPMILRYDQKMGDSKMNVNRTINQTLGLLLDYKLGKLNAKKK